MCLRQCLEDLKGAGGSSTCTSFQAAGSDLCNLHHANIAVYNKLEHALVLVNVRNVASGRLLNDDLHSSHSYELPHCFYHAERLRTSHERNAHRNTVGELFSDPLRLCLALPCTRSAGYRPRLEAARLAGNERRYTENVPSGCSSLNDLSDCAIAEGVTGGSCLSIYGEGSWDAAWHVHNARLCMIAARNTLQLFLAAAAVPRQCRWCRNACEMTRQGATWRV